MNGERNGKGFSDRTMKMDRDYFKEKKTGSRTSRFTKCCNQDKDGISSTKFRIVNRKDYQGKHEIIEVVI